MFFDKKVQQKNQSQESKTKQWSKTEVSEQGRWGERQNRAVSEKGAKEWPHIHHFLKT